ncbi:MAG: hypothetical protein KH009_05605 [Clostridiales bacterium]|nr:hypothetical protein [Clostridiales bacterium]
MNQRKLRPGVFSSYTVGGAASGTGSRRAGLIAAVSGRSEPVWITGPAQAAEELPGEELRTLRLVLELLLRSGAGVYLCPAGEGSPEEYRAAFRQAEGEEGLDLLLCDSGEEEILSAFGDSLDAASAGRRERIGLAAVSEDGEALALAGALNRERLLLTAGTGYRGTGEDAAASPLFLAAGLAGVLLARQSPDCSLNAAVLEGLSGAAPRRTEEEVEALLAGGVTAFEVLGGRVECIRGVTTRTRTGSLPDAAYRDVSTVLIIDDVMQALREMLRQKLSGVRSSRQSLDSIASQVTVLLTQKTESGLIRDWEQPRVYVDSEDSSLCIVELSFGVAHVVSRIQVQASISV